MSFPSLQSLNISFSVPLHKNNPSDDPFASFPHTLKHLSLSHVPLYPSFCNIFTLTEFTLRDAAFAYPLDTLLDILEDNPSLTYVVLGIQFKSHALCKSNRTTTIRNKLEHLGLGVNSSNETDIKTLISYIPLHKGAELSITYDGTCVGVRTILPNIINPVHFENIASHTHMEYSSFLLRFIGPDGSFNFQLLGVTGDPLSFRRLYRVQGLLVLCRDIRTLHMYEDGVFDPLLLPALETLVVEQDRMPSNTLANLFSSPKLCPKLQKLVFWQCSISEDFLKELTQFASDLKNTTPGQLNCIEIVLKEELFESGDLVHELGKHVQQKVLVKRRLPGCPDVLIVDV